MVVSDKRRWLAKHGPRNSLSTIFAHERPPCGGAQEASPPELDRLVELTLQDAEIGELLLVALVRWPPTWPRQSHVSGPS